MSPLLGILVKFPNDCKVICISADHLHIEATFIIRGINLHFIIEEWNRIEFRPNHRLVEFEILNRI